MEPMAKVIAHSTKPPMSPLRETDPTIAAADVDALTDPRWDRLVTAHDTSIFHSPQWLRVLNETYGFPMRARLLTDEAGEASAGMAYAMLDDFLDPRIASVPFSDFCDPVAGDPHEWRSLIDALVAKRCRIDLRCVHNDLPLRDSRFAVVDRALWHAIDVRPDEDEMWRTLPGSARRALRKAQTSGLTVRFGRTEADMRAFYELHLRVRKYKYGLLAQPYRFFANVWNHILAPGDGALLLATMDDRVVGGVVFLEWQGVLYYKFNASDQAHLDARPNDRVLWEGIRYARERGLRRVDFGLTDTDQDGLVRYKRKYATEEKTITILRHHPPGAPSSRDRSGREALRDVTHLLTDPSVPDAVSERAGDALYRYFA
jgi:CelD/BcsL family acetyltransferase involved in cellulose biosynthesis